MKKTKIAAVLAVASTFACPIALVGCGGDEHTHTFDTTKWVQTEDGLGHYNPATCEHSDEKGNYGVHVYDDVNDTVCNVCDYVRDIADDPTIEVGTISGTVTAYGKNLNGVTVAVGTNTTVTGATGKYSLGNVGIADSVTVTFNKEGYRTETKTVAKSAWTDKKASLDVEMHLAAETATVSGTVKSGGVAVSGATVKLGDLTPVTTGADGAYSFEVSSATATTLTLTVTHSLYETRVENVNISVGDTAVVKNVSLLGKTVPELGDLSLITLNALTAAPASDYSFKTSGQGDWNIPTSSYNMASEGILFHEAGQDIASGSKELKLFAYSRFTFDAIEQIIVRARRFADPTHNANLQGGGYPEVYILLIAEDGTVIMPTEDPGEVVSTNDDCSVLEFTLDAPITGKYVLAVGTTRGNRAAIESIQFRGVEVNGTVAGTIKQNGAALEGATVTFGDGDPVTTGADGTFSIPVTVRKGGTEKITVFKDGVSMDIPFTADNLSGGTYAIGERELKALPLPGITQEALDALTATAATNIENVNDAKTQFTSWLQVGPDNGSANEGWLLRDAGYADRGTDTLKVFMYKKLTFTNTQAIVVRARTFTDQNNVDDNHRNVHPEMILKIIDADGNSVNINYNVAYVDTDSDNADFYFTLDNAITGDYVLAIGMARGQRLAIGGIKYLATGEVVENTVEGTVKFEGATVKGAIVSYSFGYNIKGTAQTNEQGTFSLPVVMLKEGAVTLSIESESMSASKTITANATDFNDDGIYAAGEIVLSKTYLPGLTSETISDADFTVLSGTSWGTDAIDSEWRRNGGNYSKHGEGACIELGASVPVSYIYAKIEITEQTKYMKFNARMFVRDSDQTGYLQAMVIADGILAEVRPIMVMRKGSNVTATNIRDNMLVNDNDDYTEGVYDLSAYVGKTVVVVIQAMAPDGINKAVHNAINDIALSGNTFYAVGNATGTVKNSNGDVIKNAVVSVNGVGVKSNDDGEFEIPVAMSVNGSASVLVYATGYRPQTFNVSANDLTDGNYAKGDVALTATALSDIGLSTETLAALDKKTDATFNTDSLRDNWQHYGATSTKGEGFDIEPNNDNLVSHIYAKIEIDDNHKYMKFNARMFVRGSDQTGYLQVYVVKDDGTIVAVAPSEVFRNEGSGKQIVTDTARDGSLLVNNKDAYTEGAYDLSEFAGQTVTIVIMAELPYGKTKDVHNCINEVAFKSTPYTVND